MRSAGGLQSSRTAGERKRRQECTRGKGHVGTAQRAAGYQQGRKRLLIRRQLCQHLDLRLPASRNLRDEEMQQKPLRLRYSVDSRSWRLIQLFFLICGKCTSRLLQQKPAMAGRNKSYTNSFLHAHTHLRVKFNLQTRHNIRLKIINTKTEQLLMLYYNKSYAVRSLSVFRAWLKSMTKDFIYVYNPRILATRYKPINRNKP